MSDRLKGKRAFVTAAAAGIGRASAIAFAREGATVFATDIDEKGLAALKSEGIAEVARLDARDSAAVGAIAKRAGSVDVLLNAAGFVHHGTVLDCSDEDFERARSRLGPQPLAPLITPVRTTVEHFGRVPKVYIECLRDRAIPPSFQKKMYTTLPFQKILSLESSHSPFYSVPQELVKLLITL